MKLSNNLLQKRMIEPVANSFALRLKDVKNMLYAKRGLRPGGNNSNDVKSYIEEQEFTESLSTN